MSQRKENIELDMELSQIEKMDKVLNPKVSVIVPAFNVEKYISKCILSLVNQTLKDIEIVVINDGSTDKTLEIVQKFEELDKRIRIINQENQKQGTARNKGIEIAHGEYIGFVDSDDYVDLDYFEKLYEAIKTTNADIAATNILKHKRLYNKYNVLYKKLNIAETIEEKIKLCEDRKHRFFNVMNKLYKASLIKEHKILFPEGCFFEDVIFSMKTIYCANKIVSCPNTKYHYNENLTSTVNSKKDIDKKQQDRKQAYVKLQNFARKLNNIT